MAKAAKEFGEYQEIMIEGLIRLLIESRTG